MTRPLLLLCLLFAAAFSSPAQSVLFDFDGATIYSSMPIDQTAGGITAHFTTIPPGYSIQAANVLGFTPTGFSGLIIYPNSNNLVDLYIRFDQTLADFSIMYCCQELGCDDAATMRVTAYMSGALVGSNTRTATHPGTWPTDTLSCSFPQGFDSVVVHYDSRPPTCADYGTIFMADNMIVTPQPASSVSDRSSLLPERFSLGQNYPNPFNPSTTITFSVPHRVHVLLAIYNLLGEKVAELVNGEQLKGNHSVVWRNDNVPSGVYYYRMTAGAFSATRKMLVVQ